MATIKEFEHLTIPLTAVQSATNDFSDSNRIGNGGFGKVYHGELIHSDQRTTVAVKRLDRRFGQGDPEFWKEIMMLSLYKHENIVSLLGFCNENDEKIIVYEYASNRSLDLYLNRSDLTWIQRLHICIGAARGLEYLHDPKGTQQRILHRDIKSSNILLDENWKAKISDFGLAKLGPANQPHTFLVSNMVGTFGYCDPLYMETGYLSKKSDVYSFGVVLFEVLCGRLCYDKHSTEPVWSFASLVRKCYEQNKINEIIFEDMKDQIKPNTLRVFVDLAYKCLKKKPKERPTMTQIVKELEIALQDQVIITPNQISKEIGRLNSSSDSGGPGSSTSEVFDDDIETEANSYFIQMFSGQLTVDAVIQMLVRFKESSVEREQSIFEFMISNLFEEYKFFSSYPDKQLKLAANLYGLIILYQLVNNLSLSIALQGVLDALRKPADSKMFAFGIKALKKFVERLVEWPQYCQEILQIPHLRDTHSELIAITERALARHHDLEAKWAANHDSNFICSPKSPSPTV